MDCDTRIQSYEQTAAYERSNTNRIRYTMIIYIVHILQASLKMLWYVNCISSICILRIYKYFYVHFYHHKLVTQIVKLIAFRNTKSVLTEL